MTQISSSLAIVVGAGASGCAAVKLLHSQGYRVRLLDTKAIPETLLTWARAHQVETHIGPHEPAHFEGASLIIPSPGVAVQKLKAFMPKNLEDASNSAEFFMAETELAWRSLNGEALIAVTGTSGKTTTSSLFTAMLEAQGLKVFTGGNIGTPLSRYVLDCQAGAPKADVLVLELSSFQLQNCSTLRPHVAILLNISENHLDYHADMHEYIDAKMHIFANQQSTDVAIVHESLDSLMNEHAVTSSIRYFGSAPYDGTRFTNMKLMGKHNQMNAEVAALACAALELSVNESIGESAGESLGLPFDVAKQAAATFNPIEHRLELIATKKDVRYVNDSKCTTVDALRVALEACPAPILLLAGGVYKGGDLTSLIPILQDKVRAVALFGGSQIIFEKAWQGHIPLSWDATLEGAVCRHHQAAKAGEIILLAPATSSYDQYNNYMRRGEDFKRIVLEVLPC